MPPLVKIHKIMIPQDVLNTIPAPLARRLKVLPINRTEDVLTVAVSPNCEDDHFVELLEQSTGQFIQVRHAENEAILFKAIRRFYPEAQAVDGPDSTARRFETLVNRALQMRVSDIHLCPEENGGTVKFRIDGHLLNDSHLKSGAFSELVTVIKIMAQLDIAEHRTPLDGNIHFESEGEEISLRVATIPTINGEHVTLRLLTQNDNQELESIRCLGMNPHHLETLEHAIGMPNGIILLSGPTGSGKTTTLYAILRQLRAGGERHLVSIEDPVEKPIAGVTQIKVDADSERITFNKALRSILRHDPDVIMIGEIRDAETADIAVKSALTGHLVLSTLHTNSAAGVLTRLINLGISPFLVAATLRLAIAQRLLRVPCPNCMKKRMLTPEEIEQFGLDPNAGPFQVPQAVGCSLCGETGYAGRLGIYEMIPVNHAVEQLLLDNADERQIEDCAFAADPNRDLRQDVVEKMLALQTTPEEARTLFSCFQRR